MKYQGKRFSVYYGSERYRKNWEMALGGRRPRTFAKVTIVLLLAFLAILCWFGAFLLSVRRADGAVRPPSTVLIQAFNPYRIDVSLEIKCDHDWLKGRYRFHQFVAVPGKGRADIVAPNNMARCEIWPKIKW